MKAHGLNICTKGVLALILLASGLFVGACSFETSLSGLECKDENTTRAGEVCRDGYWRIDDVDDVDDVKEDIDLDGVSDTTPPEDTTPLPDVITCVAPEQLCGNRCVDTQTSSSHCGACDAPCANGLICDDGECVTEPFCEPGASRTCFAGNDIIEQGACEGGTQYCADDGTWGECIGQISPVAEMCNGEDDDCDGEIDEGNPEGGAACEIETNQGICRAGTETCQGGNIVCVADSDPVAESCGPDGTGNGLDDNCDGEIDEGCASCVEGATQSCYSGSSSDTIGGPSVCRNGVQTCTGGEWGACEGEVTPSVELCNDNGLDENCDGTVNEGCECLNGATQSCGSNVGICEVGVETCANGVWGACTGGVSAQPAELCNGLDDNCNNEIDETFPTLGQPCSVGSGVCANTGILVCSASSRDVECNAVPNPPQTFYRDADGDGFGNPHDTQTGCTAPAGYVEDNTDCDDSDPAVKPGAPEVCDGKDNNCSGTVDDGGSAMCGGGQACQDGSCCRESDSGTNRCLGRYCDSNNGNCASGYCEIVANRVGSGRNDICQPAHCGNGTQDGNETGVDCGGSCRKCNGESCGGYAECNSDSCSWPGPRVCE